MRRVSKAEEKRRREKKKILFCLKHLQAAKTLQKPFNSNIEVEFAWVLLCFVWETWLGWANH